MLQEVYFAMIKSRFTVEQIAFALKQAEIWTKVSEICRKMGVAEATFQGISNPSTNYLSFIPLTA